MDLFQTVPILYVHQELPVQSYMAVVSVLMVPGFPIVQQVCEYDCELSALSIQIARVVKHKTYFGMLLSIGCISCKNNIFQNV